MGADRSNETNGLLTFDASISAPVSLRPTVDDRLEETQERVLKLFDNVRRPTEAELRELDRLCTLNMAINLDNVAF